MKPLVHYDCNCTLSSITLGSPAIVFPTDHPLCSNRGPVMTSVVVKHNKETGEFETENTRYVPCPVV